MRSINYIVVGNLPAVGLFGLFSPEAPRALTFDRAANISFSSSSSCSFCSDIPPIQTLAVGITALPRWRSTDLLGGLSWIIFGKLQRGLMPVRSIFLTTFVEASPTLRISATYHELSSLEPGHASTTSLAASFCAVVHSESDSLTRSNIVRLSSPNLDGFVSG